MDLNVILYEPEIPPNTGNIMRLCANTGARLHLIHPLAFSLEERALRRAGLDYRDFADVREHTGLDACLQALGVAIPAPGAQGDPMPGAGPAVYAFSTRNARAYTAAVFRPGDALLFGPETRGLPRSMLDGLPSPWRLKIPMRAGSRSLNLSNAVAVAVFEAWRQWDFSGAAG
ncbi:MAG: tRNA (cytidine(34)-2'-O)-methyltransferase [Pseudomonadota bacterium]